MMKTREKKLNLPPTHPEVTRRVIESIRQMTPEEAKAFLEYRTPGIEETWLGRPLDHYDECGNLKPEYRKSANGAS